MTEPIIRVRALAERFGEMQAVAGVDFDVREGDLFGFLGPKRRLRIDDDSSGRLSQRRTWLPVRQWCGILVVGQSVAAAISLGAVQKAGSTRIQPEETS